MSIQGIKYKWTVFQKLTVLGTAAVYFLIFVGGLVRVSGAGMGCPDWPKCFGRWIPPVNIGQLPQQFDPSQFNFALAWIEYVNRLAGVSVGLIIVAIGLVALKNYRIKIKIILPAVIVGLLTAFQGWQGSQVVASELEPYIISLHMGLAFLIAILMIYLTTQAFLIEDSSESNFTVVPKQLKLWTMLLLFLILTQVIAGTLVRGAFETVVNQFPLLTHNQWLEKVGNTITIHSLLGIITLFLTFYVSTSILQKSEKISSIVWQATLSVLILMFLQSILGGVLMILNLWQVLQVMHMWFSSLIIGLITLSLILMKSSKVNS